MTKVFIATETTNGIQKTAFTSARKVAQYFSRGGLDKWINRGEKCTTQKALAEELNDKNYLNLLNSESCESYRIEAVYFA